MKINALTVNDVELCRFSEIIKVENDKSIFEIYREGETIFLFDKEPVSIVWHDEGPSSGHYYSLIGIDLNETVRKQLDAFEDLVQDEIFNDTNLLTLFETYKPLLKSGLYRFFYSPPHQFTVTGFSSNRMLKPFSLQVYNPVQDSRSSLYLEEGVFMFAQSMETIDEERVEYYKKQILKGRKPTIIALGMQPKEEGSDDVYSQFKDSYPQFIIDGHHKALAYKQINEESNLDGTPVDILVPGVFHIVRIPNKESDTELDKNKRKDILSTLLTEREVNEVIRFYREWYS